MLLRMIYDESLAQAAWLIGCQRTGEAIVVDPERDVDRYLSLAAKEGLRVTAVAETHIHADFLSGARELAEQVGAMLYLSDEGDADWKYRWLNSKRGGGSYAHRLLRHGDTFKVGGIEFKALHTPGHTPEHLCYLVTDRGGGANEPIGILTGDFLFVGDLGRPDLLETAAGHGGSAKPSAERLFKSLEILRSLPDWLQVWPGHGAGSACGKALGAVPQTTVGYEKRFNAALAAATSERAFVDFILSGQPEPPLYFARMKRDNRDGPRLLGGLPKPEALTAQSLASLDPRRTAILDTRSWEAFRAGHVPGSLFQPLGRSFTVDVGSMVDEGEPIALIVEPDRLEEAIRMLVRIGLDEIVGWYDPSQMEAYRRAGGRLAPSSEIPIAEAESLFGSPSGVLLDVRRADECAAGRINGAKQIAHMRLRAHLDELPRDRHIFVHCRSGARSARATALLERHGFRATNLAGGYLAWERRAAAAAR